MMHADFKKCPCPMSLFFTIVISILEGPCRMSNVGNTLYVMSFTSLGPMGGGSRCRMSIIRKGNVALSNLRNTTVALSRAQIN